MTIQRKYSLPNCTLLLEGLSDGSLGGQSNDVRPLLSILVNAECYLAGSEQPLSGGRDFFESLVTAISGYAQEFLSKVQHPEAHRNEPGLVQLHKVDNNRHRLIVNNGSGEQGVNDGSSRPITQVDLTTVQLFDLVEAVDQFFADSQTLPDITLQLKPISKRYAASGQMMVKQAVPAAVGVSSLSLAAIAFLFVPIPETERRPEPAPEANSSQSPSPPTATNPLEPVGTPSPTPLLASPSASDLESTLNTGSEITDASQLYALNRKLYDQVDKAWKTRSTENRDLVYRVGVAPDGAILGYKAVTAASNDGVEQTPLPSLLYNPVAGRNTSQEPVAQFRVVFTKKGVLQVSPWRGYTAPPKVLGPEITDPTELGNLQQKVYDQIRQRAIGTPTYQRNLVYRVATNKDGAVADYEPINQVAFDYVEQTPLPNLLQSGNTPPVPATENREPLAQFKLVFKPNGDLEVSPWRGY